MIDNKGFILCSVCRGKTKQIAYKNTEIVNFPLFCPKCKQVSMIDVKNGVVKLSK